MSSRKPNFFGLGVEMSYNQYPNNNRYSNNYSQDEPVWPIILGILGLFALIALLAKYGESWANWFRSHDTGTIVAYVFLFIFGTVAVSSIMWALGTALLKWWDGIGNWLCGTTYEPYKPPSTVKNTNTTGYLAPKPKTNTTVYDYSKGTYLTPSERRRPPRAEFFGRLEGKSLHCKGLYEERWLNIHEYNYWMEQKEREEARKTGLLDKNVLKDPLVVNTTTKIDF